MVSFQRTPRNLYLKSDMPFGRDITYASFVKFIRQEPDRDVETQRPVNQIMSVR